MYTINGLMPSDFSFWRPWELQSFHFWCLNFAPGTQSHISPNSSPEISILGSCPGRPGTLVSILIPQQRETTLWASLFFCGKPWFYFLLNDIEYSYIMGWRRSGHILNNIMSCKLFYGFSWTSTECIWDTLVPIPIREGLLVRIDKVPVRVVMFYELSAAHSFGRTPWGRWWRSSSDTGLLTVSSPSAWPRRIRTTERMVGCATSMRLGGLKLRQVDWRTMIATLSVGALWVYTYPQRCQNWSFRRVVILWNLDISNTLCIKFTHWNLFGSMSEIEMNMHAHAEWEIKRSESPFSSAWDCLLSLFPVKNNTRVWRKET